MEVNDEARIARGLREGDAEAWARLYDAYAERVWRTVAWLLGDDASQVGDVVQEVFVAAARSARGYDPRRGSLRAWLGGIVRGQVARYYRTRSRMREITKAQEWWSGLDGERSAALEVGGMPPPEALISAELATLVRRALVSLPADYQVLLLDKYVDEMPVEEIARQLGSSQAAIRSKLARARKAFCRAFRKITRPRTRRYRHEKPQA